MLERQTRLTKFLQSLWLGQAQRPAGLDTCLSATALFTWFALNSLQVEIAASRHHLTMVINAADWFPQWPWVPLLLAVVGLALGHFRLTFPSLDSNARNSRHHRLQQLAHITFALTLLRGLSLWPPLLSLFPFLSVLWSPHATWALSLLFLLFPHRPASSRHPLVATLALFLFFGALYTVYALYFCQVTMLHGDEGQYLRVSQSLLHDGDMDLSNNNTADQEKEFHVLDFAENKAASSPAGKLYSVHPIGVSVLAVPAYVLGLNRWQNPRLGVALLLAVMTAACVCLSYLWLVRLDFPASTSLIAVVMAGLNAPIFLFSNQIYPEIPALFIMLVTLVPLTHWQVSGGNYRSMGRIEPLILGLLTLIIGTLPFIHPRLLPVAVVIGLPILLQTWNSPQRHTNCLAVGFCMTVGLLALLIFNYRFSGDWLGHFRPGNAWASGALSLQTLAIALPGQWLDGENGLLNNSPVFFLAIPGWALLAQRIDRRFWLAGALFLSTGVVNGLNAFDWTMGFCYPVRFFVTALPALLIGLTSCLVRISGSPAACFLTFGAFTIGVDGITTMLCRPEMAYNGDHLILRDFAHYYPIDAHFSFGAQHIPALGILLFWISIIIGTTALTLRTKLSFQRRAIIIAVATITPTLWGRTELARMQLSSHCSMYLNLRETDGSINPAKALGMTFTNRYYQTTGETVEDGRSHAVATEHHGGILAAHRIPSPLTPGWVRVELPDLEFHHPPDQVAGHLVVEQKYILPVMGSWGRRTRVPFYRRDDDRPTSLDLVSDRTAGGYVWVEFSGHGEVFHKRAHVLLVPQPPRARVEPQHEFTIANGNNSEDPLSLGVLHENMQPGRYRVHFEISGDGFETFFQRNPPTIVTAVYSGHPARPTTAEQLRTMVRNWFIDNRDFLRPQSEGEHPPWWLSLPVLGDEAFDLRFTLQGPSDVWFMVKYDGPQYVEIDRITIYREHFQPFITERPAQ